MATVGLLAGCGGSEIAAAIHSGDIDDIVSVIVDIGRADLLEETPDGVLGQALTAHDW